jgi:hypothetical protein
MFVFAIETGGKTVATPEYTKHEKEVDEGLLSLFEEGLIFDSGRRKWSAQFRRYEIVWKLTKAGLASARLLN